LTDTTLEADRLDIAASLNGEGEAYARLVRRYQTDIAARMRRFTRDPAVLDELVQDVFVEAYLSLKGFRGRAPFIHWLRKVATRTGYRYWKSRAGRMEKEQELTETILNLAAEPSELSASEAAETLYRLLERLKPPDRLVLTLFYFEDCDIEEIAGRTGWTRTGTRVRLHRARGKLGKILNEEGFRSIADV
jgi:RNA polymerase sigma-70 factor (ECF subfamily)